MSNVVIRASLRSFQKPRIAAVLVAGAEAIQGPTETSSPALGDRHRFALRCLSDDASRMLSMCQRDRLPTVSLPMTGSPEVVSASSVSVD